MLYSTGLLLNSIVLPNNYYFRPCTARLIQTRPGWALPGRAGRVLVPQKVVGYFGEYFGTSARGGLSRHHGEGFLVFCSDAVPSFMGETLGLHEICAQIPLPLGHAALQHRLSTAFAMQDGYRLN